MKIIFEGKNKNSDAPVVNESSNEVVQPVQPKKKWSKEKIIIIALAVILVGLGLFVSWDLWGKKFSYNCPTTTSSSTSTTGTTTKSSTKKGGSTTAVDASLYASCTVKIADEKVYKSCCDALSVDDTVKKACKKVVDDKNGTTPTTTTPSTTTK